MAGGAPHPPTVMGVADLVHCIDENKCAVNSVRLVVMGGYRSRAERYA